jgi:3-hydroxyisobutyrate dehydrogenase-like beta-hydroxyacid dehydrogenase
VRAGLLFPGEMGATVGAAVQGEVLWASEGRSQATRQRAATFTDVASLDELVRSSDLILSICPPAIAEELARQVFGLGFGGVYVDANAISPERMRRIATLGPRVVDGSIVAKTGINLYLSGADAPVVASVFGDGDVRAIDLRAELGTASALKMAFGGWNKIGTVMTGHALEIARRYGVTQWLEAEGVSPESFSRIADRAWRWAPEMEEIGDTCVELGLSDEVPRAGAALYRDLGEKRS